MERYKPAPTDEQEEEATASTVMDEEEDMEGQGAGSGVPEDEESMMGTHRPPTVSTLAAGGFQVAKDSLAALALTSPTILPRRSGNQHVPAQLKAQYFPLVRRRRSTMHANNPHCGSQDPGRLIRRPCSSSCCSSLDRCNQPP